jgi:hypothetical protein
VVAGLVLGGRLRRSGGDLLEQVYNFRRGGRAGLVEELDDIEGFVLRGFQLLTD